MYGGFDWGDSHTEVNQLYGTDGKVAIKDPRSFILSTMCEKYPDAERSILEQIYDGTYEEDSYVIANEVDTPVMSDVDDYLLDDEDDILSDSELRDAEEASRLHLGDMYLSELYNTSGESDEVEKETLSTVTFKRDEKTGDFTVTERMLETGLDYKYWYEVYDLEPDNTVYLPVASYYKGTKHGGTKDRFFCDEPFDSYEAAVEFLDDTKSPHEDLPTELREGKDAYDSYQIMVCSKDVMNTDWYKNVQAENAREAQKQAEEKARQQRRRGVPSWMQEISERDEAKTRYNNLSVEEAALMSDEELSELARIAQEDQFDKM